MAQSQEDLITAMRVWLGGMTAWLDHNDDAPNARRIRSAARLLNRSLQDMGYAPISAKPLDGADRITDVGNRLYRYCLDAGQIRLAAIVNRTVGEITAVNA
ncbi:hypothetical protein [Bifidobacterium sp. SO1]|uniref:hypothetical protein n=1 Tax=Bifidobacterium sp. SO1 TaxID=2809029 RepID=UPI001BDBD2A4|nr:hypothetical protein [Bifidobacterium sp. SO1]MBT1161839.1 hypothetical protein [Bifidobacterium sp. SO1]